MIQLGTIAVEDNLRFELRLTDVGKVGLAVQGPPDRNWVVLREWQCDGGSQPSEHDIMCVLIGVLGYRPILLSQPYSPDVRLTLEVGGRKLPVASVDHRTITLRTDVEKRLNNDYAELTISIDGDAVKYTVWIEKQVGRELTYHDAI